MQDLVPKSIMNFLVAHVQRGLHQHLIQALYREEMIADLVSEREDIVVLRQRCQQAVLALRAALSTLEAIPKEMSRKMAAGSMSMQLPKGHLAAALAGGGAQGKENGFALDASQFGTPTRRVLPAAASLVGGGLGPDGGAWSPRLSASPLQGYGRSEPEGRVQVQGRERSLHPAA